MLGLNSLKPNNFLENSKRFNRIFLPITNMLTNTCFGLFPGVKNWNKIATREDRAGQTTNSVLGGNTQSHLHLHLFSVTLTLHQVQEPGPEPPHETWCGQTKPSPKSTPSISFTLHAHNLVFLSRVFCRQLQPEGIFVCPQNMQNQRGLCSETNHAK